MDINESGISIEDADLSFEELEEMERQEKERWAKLQASYSPEDRLKLFNARSLLTKEAVIEDVNLRIAEVAAQIEPVSGDQQRYLKAKRDFLQKFVEQIQSTVLFATLEPWWAYQYRYNSRGITLELMHIDYRSMMICDKGDYFCFPDTIFPVVKLEARTMSVEEYAKYMGKSEAAIRQGLRRGKYRSAFKVGQEWRISELCPLSTERGYQRANYEWRTELAGVPEGFEYVKAPAFIDINQDEDKQNFTIYVHPWHEQDSYTRHFYRLGKTDKERLELFLISNPMVEVKDDEKIYDRRRK